MKQLILLVAPPGAGKSTYASQLEREGFTRISQDEQGKEGHLKLFLKSLEEEKNIVIDRLNFSREQRARYLNPARERGYRTRIIVLHVSSQICFDRCLERKEHPTIKTMKDVSSAINMFFSKYEFVQDNEADEVIRNFGNDKKIDAIICDLDGTLCNIDHRLHFIQDGPADSEEKQKKSWPKFFAAIKDDKVNNWCKSILDNFYDTHQIILCSGRPDDHQEATIDWIEDNNICYDKLFMRRRGDYRKDEIVKQIILFFEILPTYNISFSIDDRNQVVDMWRKNGITCLQCAHGDY